MKIWIAVKCSLQTKHNTVIIQYYWIEWNWIIFWHPCANKMMKITSNLWATTALVIGLVRLTDAPLCEIGKIVSEKNYIAVPKLVSTIYHAMSRKFTDKLQVILFENESYTNKGK